MKAIALTFFGDGKRLIEEGEVFETTRELFDQINSTDNGVLAEEVKESRAKKTKEE